MTTATRTARRTAQGAIAFTDLSGFTEFTAIKGDEAAVELLAAHERTVRDALKGRGRIVKNLGDGFLLYFSDACDAIDTALKLQEKFEEQSWEQDLPLWVRIGIHFGRPIRKGRDLIGHDVNVAARIVDLAQPGEVLVSEACTSAMKHPLAGVYFEEVGPVVMKGIPESITLYRAMRA